MKEMKNYIVMMLLCLPALMCAAQAYAVNYRSTYKAPDRGIQQMEYKVATTATAPSATFQSTSAYSDQWQGGSTTPMLNTDGSVNTDAYGVGQSNSGGHHGHIRRIDNPGENDELENPLGDGLWALLLMAGAYVVVRTARRRMRKA